MKSMEISNIRNLTAQPNRKVVLLMGEGSSTNASVSFSAFSGQEFQFSPEDNSWVRENGSKVYFREVDRPESMAVDGVKFTTFGFNRELSRVELEGIRTWKLLNL